jgi:hypothetical protein
MLLRSLVAAPSPMRPFLLAHSRHPVQTSRRAYSAAATGATGSATALKPQVVSTATPLTPLVPLEFYANGSLMFGNFVSRKSVDSTSCVVRLPSGRLLVIDVAQIIAVWDQLETSAPSSPAEWAELITQSALLLRERERDSDRDLEEFWRLSRQRSARVAVDSADLAVYLFQRRKFRAWLDPSLSSADSAVFVVTPAQRHVAALLLSADTLHFKRIPSLRQWAEDATVDGLSITNNPLQHALPTFVPLNGSGPHDNQHHQQPRFLRTEHHRYNNNSTTKKNHHEQAAGTAGIVERLFVSEGGYRVLDESIVARQLVDSFFLEYQTHFPDRTQLSPVSLSGQCPTRPLSSVQLQRIVMALEQLAVAPILPTSTGTTTGCRNTSTDRVSSNSVSAVLKLLFKRLQLPCSQASADHVLRVLCIPTRSSTATATVTVTGDTPWSAVLLSSAKLFAETLTASRQQWSHPPYHHPFDPDTTLSQPQRSAQSGWRRGRAPEGKADLRRLAVTHQPLCIDSDRSVFRDDAVSLSPDTQEVLIHVVDVFGALQDVAYPRSSSSSWMTGQGAEETESRRLTESGLPTTGITGSTGLIKSETTDPAVDRETACREAVKVLLDCARHRKQSQFATGLTARTSRALHMLPPAALAALSLSSTAPNEVITVALKIDFARGAIRGVRVFPALIGPVYPLGVRMADEVIAGVTSAVGPVGAVVHDLRLLARLCDRLCAANPWLENHRNSNSNSNEASVITGEVQASEETEEGGAYRVINTLLTLFAQEAHNVCLVHKVPVPVLWTNRDHHEQQRIRRFATSPLRNYVSILQQQQLLAALGRGSALTRSECAAAVKGFNSR